MNQWDGSDDSDQGDLAPVIPLFAERMPRPSAAASAQAIAPNHPAFAGSRSRSGQHTVRFIEAPDEPDDDETAAETADAEAPGAGIADDVTRDDATDADPGELRAHVEFAEKALLRKLRTRSLSVREARAVLVGFELAGDEIDDIIDRFEANRYLDDAALAEQLVHTGSTRKGQGRQAIGQTMSGRGIPREVADAALADLPDDDLERALDYARTKAGPLARLDQQTGLRRLVGQLTRRGYPSHIAMTAARQALDEQSRPSRGPYFS